MQSSFYFCYKQLLQQQLAKKILTWWIGTFSEELQEFLYRARIISDLQSAYLIEDGKIITAMY